MADSRVRQLISRLYMADAFGERRLRGYIFTPEVALLPSTSAICKRNASCQLLKSAIYKRDMGKN